MPYRENCFVVIVGNQLKQSSREVPHWVEGVSAPRVSMQYHVLPKAVCVKQLRVEHAMYKLIVVGSLKVLVAVQALSQLLNK